MRAFILCLLSLSATHLYAFVDFEHAFFLRIRYESRRDFNFDDAHQSYFLTALRNRFEWTWEPKTFIVFELQDARVFDENQGGFPGANAERTPNSLEDRLDLFQAYFSLPLTERGQIMIGRQRLRYGQGRYLTSPSWRNVSLTFDGVRARFGNEKERFLDVIALRPVPVRPDDFNDWADTGNPTFDSKIYGFWFEDRKTSDKHHLVSHLLLRENDASQDEVYSLMGRWLWQISDQTRLQVEYAQQWGDFAGLDHQAYAFGAQLHHQAGSWQFAAITDYASGDSDPTDDKHETFENLYPANHDRYGLMDLFALQNMYDVGFSVRRNMPAGWQLRLDGWSFWLDEEDSDAWYSSGKSAFRPAAGRDVSAFAGEELNLVTNWRGKVLQHLSGNLEIGYGHFFAGDYVEDTGTAETDATFLWTSFTLQY